jgi:hypothetical protein
MKMQKQVKIVGLSVVKNFGGLKATELTFDKDNRLTIIKGEVGSGKTTLNRAMRLTTQGSSTLVDKRLYGDIELTTQLSDGDMSIYVGCRTDKTGSLSYFLYGVDADGNKLKDVIVDGKRATPANYLSSLQTALTWRLDELTSENPVTQRRILLELYKSELESQGVIFNKAHPKYVGSLIDLIEKAKNNRSLMDMKRKEVGGIGDDLRKKGIPFDDRLVVMDETLLQQEVNKIRAKISLSAANVEQAKENKLNKIKLEVSNIVSNIKDLNAKLIDNNNRVDSEKRLLKTAFEAIDWLIPDKAKRQKVKQILNDNIPTLSPKTNEVSFGKDNKVLSKAKDFEKAGKIYEALIHYKKLGKKYKKIDSQKEFFEDTELNDLLEVSLKKLKATREYNTDAAAVNSFHDWRDSNDEVSEIKKDYYHKLTEVDTGVKGLHICTDIKTEEDENIYLMYDGSYDKKYFNNLNGNLRKLSSYSGTQKPMICLLIQRHLLSKKNKCLPYLWIDDVPIDAKTRKLLEKMAKELDLWLFVNWTGDFKASKLKNGEILLENGNILMEQND